MDNNEILKDFNNSICRNKWREEEVKRNFEKLYKKNEFSENDLGDDIGSILIKTINKTFDEKIDEYESNIKHKKATTYILKGIESQIEDEYANELISSYFSVNNKSDYEFEKGIIYNYINDIIKNSNTTNISELADHVIKNIFLLRLDFYKYMEDFLEFYNYHSYFKEVFKELDYPRFAGNFRHCCRLHKDIVRLYSKDRESSIYFMLLKVFTYYWIEIRHLKKEEMLIHLRLLEETRNSELIPIVHSMKEVVLQRYEKKMARQLLIKKLDNDKIKFIHVRLVGLLFDEATTEDQLAHFFNGDFYRLEFDRIKIHVDATFRNFNYFLQKIVFKKIMNSYGFYTELKTYSYLEQNDSVLSGSQINRADSRSLDTTNEIVKMIDEVASLIYK